MLLNQTTREALCSYSLGRQLFFTPVILHVHTSKEDSWMQRFIKGMRESIVKWKRPGEVIFQRDEYGTLHYVVISFSFIPQTVIVYPVFFLKKNRINNYCCLLAMFFPEPGKESHMLHFLFTTILGVQTNVTDHFSL